MTVMCATACGALAIGCGSSSERQPDAPLGSGSGSGSGSDQGTGNAAVGAHAINYYKLGANPAISLSTPPITTQASGSTIVVSVGRGNATLFALPTDSKGNAPYVQQGTAHPYSLYPDSGTALYTFKPAKGGANFQVTTSTGKFSTGQSDEITMAVVEVASSGKVQDVQWSEVRAPPLTSKSVTTDGPATLVAFWWGDGTSSSSQHATPDNGFTVVDTNAEQTDSFVQCAVAVKQVTAAGTYDVTWTPDPSQGAQLWLVAIE
ncbi:MAG TPA: hypothetical protein VGC42_25705 [Kofleriaceae bacterium]